MKITEKLKGKKVLLWGYGLEGRSAEAFLQTHCQPQTVEIYEGAREGVDEAAYDIILKSPGIPAENLSEKYTSSTDLFLEEFSDRVIGITGTKGKSTTASLLFHVLEACSPKKTLLVGNIGAPCLDRYDEIDADTQIVFELSCHQLAHSTVSPHIAVFLNFFEEHLDYYGTREKYFRAKANITAHQKPEDFLFVGESVPPLETRAQKQTLSETAEASAPPLALQLAGAHNQFNARVVYTIATTLCGCEDAAVREALRSFTGLPHRMEVIGSAHGIAYYDDSISTIPEATIAAAESIPHVGTILLGGMDRQIDYTPLISFIRAHPEIRFLCMYQSGKRIYEAVADLPYCYYREDLSAAVALARTLTRGGEACLLSPAAASYGYFKNFEERGDAFRKLALQETTLAFTGDIGFDHFMQGRWEDAALLDVDIRTYLTSADHVIVNVEGALVGDELERVHSAEERLMHTISPAVAPMLRDLGADIWNLNNNHIMDAGEEGLCRSLEVAHSVGARTLGVGKTLEEAMQPVLLPEAGGIGLFSVGYRRGCKPAGEQQAGCLTWNEMEKIRGIIETIKQTCRWCIVVVHGGEEFTALPSPYTRDRYHAYLEMGADLVVGHHPHVPMNYELVGEKAIFYSLGNFIFDTPYQRAQYHTEEGILLKLRLTEETWAFEAMGIRIDRQKECVLPGALPAIFTDVPEEEYLLLAPLAAKMFVEATKRQQIFLYPETFAQATEETWQAHFAEPRRSGRVPGEALDFLVLCPLAAEAERGAWKESTQEAVKNYLLEQLEPMPEEGRTIV